MARSRRPARAAAPAPAAPDAERAARALWIGLAALAAARLLLAFGHGMWLWGLETQRFLDPLFAWAPWAIGVASLAPLVARPFESPLARLGDALARGSVPAGIALALATALLVLGSPDNTQFVGDFLLRQGTVEMAGKPAMLFPQALPFDVLLHYTLPSALQDAHVLSANAYARLLGGLNAALLAWFVARLVCALGFSGAAASSAWAVGVFGAGLGMFTGYSKSLAELSMLAAAIAAFGVNLAREGRGALGLSLAFAASLALHRSGLVFAVPVVVAFGLAAGGARAGAPFWRRPISWIALAVPLATFALVARRVIGTLVSVDVAVHLNPAEAQREGFLAAAFGGLRTLDLLNLVLLFSPLLPVAIAAALARRARRVRPISDAGAGRARPAAVLLALALPLLVGAPFIHPAQGLFRDWDDFAALGVALSLIAAWCAGAALSGARARLPVAAPLVLAAVIPAVQWLALHANVDQGLARARAFVTEPPARPPSERVGVWDFIGIRNYRLGRYVASADALSRAAADAPSPRLLQEWATSATEAGQLRTAQEVYHRLVEKDPRNTTAWLGLGAVASRIPDVDDSFRAIRQLLAIDPGNPGGRQIMEYLRKKYPDHP